MTKPKRKHMKAHTPPTSFKGIRHEVRKEMGVYREEIYCEAAEDLIPQVMAVFLWTISVNYGWKKDRLRQLAEALHETEYLMDNPSRLHHRFSPLDCEKEIKERYGIDIRAEFPVRVSDMKGKVLNSERQTFR